MRDRWGVSFLFLLPVLLLLTFWNYNNRVYDWDMPGYIGSMHTFSYPKSPDKIRKITFDAIKKEAPVEHYNDLIGTKPFDKTRQYFEKNTQSFTEQLPYFQIKVGYNYVITLIYKLGFSSPNSVLFVSLISYFFSGILFFYILNILFPQKLYFSIILTTGVLLLPPMTYMSRVSTPDMFIFQFILIFVIGLIKQWRDWSMFFLLFLITFIRPDYITFALTYLAAAFLYYYVKNKKIGFVFVIQGGMLLVYYVFIMKFYHYPGWKDLFYDSFIYRRPIISAQPADFSMKEYLEIIYTSAINFKKVTLSVLIMITMIFWLSKDLWIRLISLLFLVNVYIKFLFFPQSAALRFFFPMIFPLLVMMLYAISEKYKISELEKNP